MKKKMGDFCKHLNINMFKKKKMEIFCFLIIKIEFICLYKKKLIKKRKSFVTRKNNVSISSKEKLQMRSN